MLRRICVAILFTASIQSPTGLGIAIAKTAPQPNIIFIMADDLGPYDLGCYGEKIIETPSINRLAVEGMRFTQCYGGAAVCAPSRSVLMTGLHMGHTRVRDNKSKVGGVVGVSGEPGRVPLRKEDITVAEVLQRLGYATGMTGKWGLGEPGTDGIPNRKGFDQWFGYLNQNRAHSYYPDFIWLNEERFDLPGNTNGRRQQYSHDFFTGFALNFIRRHQDQPFFLYLPYTIPHSDYEAPDLGPYSDRDWPKGAREYAAMVTRMDGDVGRIMALLNELGIDEQTIVFFCSDHGGNNPFQSVFNSNGPLRERKGSLYEGGLRIPMIVRWPGHVAAGSVSEAVWYFTDFMPTAIELSGGKDSVHLKTDGVSIVPTLLGKDQDFADRFLYWERFGGGFQQAARWRNWKAVRNGLNGPLELYDLAKDASEARDVSTQNPEVVRQIEDYLRTARVDSEEWPVVRSKKNARKAQVTASNKK